jgi:hypothetical protein
MHFRSTENIVQKKLTPQMHCSINEQRKCVFAAKMHVSLNFEAELRSAAADRRADSRIGDMCGFITQPRPRV